MALVGPAGHPTPPSGAVRQNSKEAVGIGGQQRLAATGTSNEGHLLGQQQMWREVRTRTRRRDSTGGVKALLALASAFFTLQMTRLEYV